MVGLSASKFYKIRQRDGRASAKCKVNREKLTADYADYTDETNETDVSKEPRNRRKNDAEGIG